MEPGTGLAILGSAYGGAKIVEKLLGPTADYVGEGLKNWAEKRVQNVSRIFGKATEKLGERIDEPGGIPPKVLKEVLDEGSYCDDELTAEYFGGVLASSRTGYSRDDRAATYLKVTSQLSTYQIRFHYLAYLAWREVFKGSGLRPTFLEDREQMWIYMDYEFLVNSMDFEEGEPGEDIVMHCMTGLARAGLLIYGPWGSAEHLNKSRNPLWKVFEGTGGLTLMPEEFGIDYWLWAIGAGHISRSHFLEPELKLPALPNVKLTSLPAPILTSKA